MTTEIKKALTGAALFYPATFRGELQWHAEYNGQQLVVNRKSSLVPDHFGVYAFQAHAKTDAVTFVNLTEGDVTTGIATERNFPALLTVEFKLDHGHHVGKARELGSKCNVVLDAGERFPNNPGPKWLVRPVGRSCTRMTDGTLLEVRVRLAAELISPITARRRSAQAGRGKRPRDRHEVVVEGSEEAAIAAEVLATA